MTQVIWNVLDEENYKSQLLSFIADAEGYELQSYLDTANIPTIGIGFNLRDENVLRSTLLTIFYPEGNVADFMGEDSNFAEDIQNAVGQTYSSNFDLQGQLNSIMAERVAYWQDQIDQDPNVAHPSTTRPTLAFSSEQEMQDVFDIVVPTYESRVDNCEPPPINESGSRVNLGILWTHLWRSRNGSEEIYDRADYRVFASGRGDDRAWMHD